MLEVAKIQSTGASNRIEGIYTSEARLTELVKDKASQETETSKKLPVIREVLNTIHESFEYIVPRSNVILQLHRDLYSYNPSSMGGRYKSANNLIEEVNSLGQRRGWFQPLPAYATPEAVDNLCNTFLKSLDEGKVDPLLLISMFILDFLCIHPFSDENGRMSRLLTLLLLYREGYIVGKYISFEMIIEKTKESYYEALAQSSQGWHEGHNSYEPLVKYYLGIVLNVYKEFESRVEYIRTKGVAKADRIRNVFAGRIGKITKAELLVLCPDISVTTIEKALSDLLKEGYIFKVGAGRTTAYIRNQEE